MTKIKISKAVLAQITTAFQNIKTSHEGILVAIKAAYEENKDKGKNTIEILQHIETSVMEELSKNGVEIPAVRFRRYFTAAARTILLGIEFNPYKAMSWDRAQAIALAVSADKSNLSVDKKYRAAENASRKSHKKTTGFGRIPLPSENSSWVRDFLIALKEITLQKEYQTLTKNNKDLLLIAKVLERANIPAQDEADCLFAELEKSLVA